MKRIYLDTCYLFKLYWEEPESERVRKLVSTMDRVQCAWHGRAEFSSILLRKRREGVMDQHVADIVEAQLEFDRRNAAVEFLPQRQQVMDRFCLTAREAPETTNLRAADGLHLACAACHGYQTVYSNDGMFLKAAPLFGIEGSI